MTIAGTILSCTMTLAQLQPALAGKSVIFNQTLSEATAAQMAHAEEPLQPIVFVGEPGAAPGWIIHNAIDQTASPIMLSRVVAKPSLSLRQGKAERLPDGRYRFTEQMRGTCKLVAESDLK